MFERSPAWIVIVSILLLPLGLAACGGGKASLETLVSQGNDAMSQGDFEVARDYFEQAAGRLVQEEADEALTFEVKYGLVRCKIREGEADDAKAEFLRLADENPSQATWKKYRSVAGSLRASDEKPLAIEILDLGLKKFPDHASDFEADIQAIQDEADIDAETKEKLKKLGYVK